MPLEVAFDAASRDDWLEGRDALDVLDAMDVARRDGGGARGHGAGAGEGASAPPNAPELPMAYDVSGGTRGSLATEAHLYFVLHSLCFTRGSLATEARCTPSAGGGYRGASSV